MGLTSYTINSSRKSSAKKRRSSSNPRLFHPNPKLLAKRGIMKSCCFLGSQRASGGGGIRHSRETPEETTHFSERGAESGVNDLKNEPIDPDLALVVERWDSARSSSRGDRGNGESGSAGQQVDA